MVPMGLVTFLEFGCPLEVFQDGFARDDAWAASEFKHGCAAVTLLLNVLCSGSATTELFMLFVTAVILRVLAASAPERWMCGALVIGEHLVFER